MQEMTGVAVVGVAMTVVIRRLQLVVMAVEVAGLTGCAKVAGVENNISLTFFWTRHEEDGLEGVLTSKQEHLTVR